MNESRVYCYPVTSRQSGLGLEFGQDDFVLYQRAHSSAQAFIAGPGIYALQVFASVYGCSLISGINRRRLLGSQSVAHFEVWPQLGSDFA